MTRRWRALVLVALVGAAPAACSDDGPGEGEARLEVSGQAEVERADGDREVVDDSTDLDTGDRVVVKDGVAVMRLHGGTTFELRTGLDDAADTTVLMGSPPVLEAGDLLVTTPESTRIEADGTEVTVREGAARLTRAFGMSVSAYDADLELDSAGVAAEVRSLRQVAVPDLGRPRPPRPVDFVEADPWDRRYLGAAHALGKELETWGDGLTEMLSEGEGRTIGYLRLVIPNLEHEEQLSKKSIASSLVDRDAGENVVGAAITEAGERGSFEDRWESVFGFREEGAEWGIVALDQAVNGANVSDSVEQAFNASVAELTQAPSTGETASGGEAPSGTDTGGSEVPSGGTGGTGGTTGGGDGGSGGPTAPPTTPPLPPPLTPPPPSEPPAELDPVVEPVVDLVDDLLGGLLG